MEIKNLKKAADRIKAAVENKERIILYGDADLDGTTSVIILDEAIKNLGGQTSAVYFPNRETQGYGINQAGLNFLKKYAPALLVSLDLGIGNIKEVEIAKKMGFEVIIVDHHEILDSLPKAKIVVDPKQKGDRTFKGLANVGITFKLVELILGDKMTENLRKNFLELVALATIADMMPREEENEIFITEGLRNLEQTWRPGLQAFFETGYFDLLPLSQKVAKMIQVLNTRDVENEEPASFRLLTNHSLEECKDMVRRLLAKAEQKREKIDKISQDIEKRMHLASPLIFEGDTEWEFYYLSAAASILSQKHKKPTFLYKKLQDESQGTVRMPTGGNAVAMMKKCKKYLLTFGGHPMAAGFRVKNENLENFKTCLLKQLK
jgi:single-stranded-DNA-specific exonuclease